MNATITNELEVLEEETEDETHVSETILHRAVAGFSERLQDSIIDTDSLLEYIEKNDLNDMLECVQMDMNHLKHCIQSGEDLELSIMDLGLSCVCLYERMKKDEKRVKIPWEA